MANDSKDSILKNTGLITLCTLGSRVTGLLRTWAMAFALGNTLLTSAYQIAYNMPSMIYELAASGLLATAFLPLYLLQKEKKGNGEAYKFASNILTLTIVLLGILALACSVFSPLVIETQTFTVGQGDSKTLAIFFFRIFAIQILFYGVGAVITGILNANLPYAVVGAGHEQYCGNCGDVRLRAAFGLERGVCAVVAGYWHFAGRAVPVRHPDSRIGEAGFPLPSSHQSA